MYRVLPVLLLLTACAEPNQLGNPLTWPIRAVTNAALNTTYASDRAKVAAFLTEHEAVMRASGFSGARTGELLRTIPTVSQEKVRGELREAATQPDYIERATVIVMVHR